MDKNRIPIILNLRLPLNHEPTLNRTFFKSILKFFFIKITNPKYVIATAKIIK